MSERNDILKALHEQMKKENHLTGQPFSVPENYFSELEHTLLKQVLTEDGLDEISLAGEGKKPTFQVPGGYFDDLSKNILRQIAPAPVKTRFLYKWQQIAAGLITGLAIAGGIHYWKGASPKQTAVQNTSAGRPLIQNISANELRDFAEEGFMNNMSGPGKKNAVDINQLFQQVTSQDLENFLNETAVNNSELF
jgi:hypothetical protein